MDPSSQEMETYTLFSSFSRYNATLLPVYNCGAKELGHQLSTAGAACSLYVFAAGVDAGWGLLGARPGGLDWGWGAGA